MSGNRFDSLGFSDFRKMAGDPNLSPNERIGFPDAYRQGFDAAIHADITAKVPNLQKEGITVLDIGPGCAGLPRLLIENCNSRNQRLVLIDSPEMLAHLPDAGNIVKIPGFYPDCMDDSRDWTGKFDAIVCYSVFHYVFVEARFWRFIDLSIRLLAPGGQMLIGDIPNVSKRKRFFASPAGIAFHQDFMKTTESPVVEHGVVEDDRIDDAVIMGVLMRARAQGCDAYWLAQPPHLPMANRREDIVISKP